MQANHPTQTPSRRPRPALPWLCAGLTTLLLAAVAVPVRAQAPANDNFENRQVLPGVEQVDVPGTTIGSTLQPLDRSLGVYGDNTVWFSWTAPAAGTVNLATVAGTTYNYVGLFTPGGNLANGLSLIDKAFGTGDDGEGGRFVPEFVFPVRAGQEIDILVSNGSVPQNFRLRFGLTPDTVNPPPPPPAAQLTASVATTVTPASAATGQKGRFVVTLSAPSAEEAAVTYLVGGTAVGGVDYKTLPGFVVIPAGQTSATIKVKPLPVGSGTAGKVKVQLQPGAGYTVGDPAVAKVKIL